MYYNGAFITVALGTSFLVYSYILHVPFFNLYEKTYILNEILLNIEDFCHHIHATEHNLCYRTVRQ